MFAAARHQSQLPARVVQQALLFRGGSASALAADFPPRNGVQSRVGRRKRRCAVVAVCAARCVVQGRVACCTSVGVAENGAS